MMKRSAVILFAMLGACLLAQTASAQTPKLVSGKIKDFTITNPEFQRGLTRTERAFAINLHLDAHPDFLLGLSFEAKRGIAGIDHQIFLLLKLAFEHDLPVVIRWRATISHSGQYPPFARIVSVQLRR